MHPIKKIVYCCFSCKNADYIIKHLRSLKSLLKNARRILRFDITGQTSFENAAQIIGERLPDNGKVALVFCPSWSNVPPISLAYLKSAIQCQQADCFDLNLQFYQKYLANSRAHFDCQFPKLRPFFMKNAIFGEFEESCVDVYNEYRDVICGWAKILSAYPVVSLSLYQENVVVSTILARLLRSVNPAVTIIAGGPTINMDQRVYTKYLLGNKTIDIAVFGIGEDVIDRICAAICAQREPIHNIPGLAFVKNGKIVFTECKKTILKELHCPPDYSDFNLNAYYKDREDWLSVYAVTGCVGHCEFCTIDEFYDRYQAKSTEAIQREMLYLRQKHGSNKIFFSDGMFLACKKHAMEIFNFAVKNDFKLGIQIRLLPYWNDEEVVEAASKCVFFLQSGFESASQVVRKDMGKMVDHEATMGFFRLAYKHKIPLYTNIIIGYPSETNEEFLHTYAFLEEYLQKSSNSSFGMNSFFIPNGFPCEKYGLAYDEKGHWFTDVCRIDDRCRRVGKIYDLVNRMGCLEKFGYAHDSVEGVSFPKKSLLDDLPVKSVSPQAADAIPGAGNIDLFEFAGTLINLQGWIVDSKNKRIPEYIVAVDSESGKIIAADKVKHSRPDVAAVFHESAYTTAGWMMAVDDFRPSGKDRKILKLYGLSNGCLIDFTHSTLLATSTKVYMQ